MTNEVPIAYLYMSEDGSKELIFDCNGEHARVLLDLGYTETPLFASRATDTALAEELRAKLLGTTPGDWEVEDPMDHELMIVEAGKEAYEWRPIAGCPFPDERGDIPRKQVEANAEFIAWVKSNSDRILAVLEGKRT